MQCSNIRLLGVLNVFKVLDRENSCSARPVLDSDLRVRGRGFVLPPHKFYLPKASPESDHVQERRFAAAARADDRQKFSFLNGQIDLLHGGRDFPAIGGG